MTSRDSFQSVFLWLYGKTFRNNGIPEDNNPLQKNKVFYMFSKLAILFTALYMRKLVKTIAFAVRWFLFFKYRFILDMYASFAKFFPL